MNIDIESVSGVTFLNIVGNLDLANTEHFEEVLGEMMDDNKSRIVINLSQCLGVTSKAIGLLMWSKAEAKGAGGDVFLMNPHPKVHSLLKLIGLGDVLRTVTSQEEAIKLLTSK